MSERVTWVDYEWRDEVNPASGYIPGDTMAQVVILNDPDLYEKMVEDEDFDQRIWFYFQDEAEFQRAFDPKNEEHDFYLVREHTEIEGDKFWIDDETLMARIGTPSWWDSDTEEWRRPDGEGEDEFDSRVSAHLGQLLTPERASTYFATDGSYGTAHNLEVIDTSEWTDEDWAEIENATDDTRADTASAIAKRYLNAPDA